MFSDKILEKIFADPEAQKIETGTLSTVISIVEHVLEEMGVNTDVTISES